MAEQTWPRSVTGLIAMSLCLGSGTLGCSSNSETSAGQDPGDAGLDDVTISCANDPRVQPFMLNMTHKGDSGMLSFVISGATFNPPAIDNNTWTLKILDSSGQPVKDAMLTFPKGPHPSDPWMPDHTHGALPAKAVNNMDGTYTVMPLYFFMGGVWSTAMSATTGSLTDTTTFTFCIGS
jgi:hypothetical protein